MSYEEQLRASREARQRFYNSTAWKKKRADYLLNNRLCVFCKKEGRYVLATVVDHIVDISDDPELRLDPDNFQSLCKDCHDSKTAKKGKTTGIVNGGIDFSILD